MLRWYNWLYELMKKKDEEKRMEVEHQKLVSRMTQHCWWRNRSFLHKITTPTAWRGGVQILKEYEEDVKPSARCEEKRKELATHWQCDTEVQNLQDKPWGHEELRSVEEGMPRVKGKRGITRQRQEQGADGFHPKNPLDYTKKQEEKWSGGIIGDGGAVCEMPVASMHDDVLLDSKERHERTVTSERPIALMLTVARCQKNRIEWDATGGVMAPLCGRLCWRWKVQLTCWRRRSRSDSVGS